jgi:hypothetical protein
MPTAVAIVACALAMLGRSERNFPPIELVDTIPIDVSVQAEAFVRPPARTIYLVTSSPMFRVAQKSRAECGDYFAVKKLASILAHEEWHVKNGSDERGAYQAQLTALSLMGVAPDNSLYTGVVRSMQAVLKKKAATPDLVLAAKQ